MTPEQKLKLLRQANQKLSLSLSQARKAASQYDHHLIQNDSAPAAERLRFLLAQAYAIAEGATLSSEQRIQLSDQLGSLHELIGGSPQTVNSSGPIRKLYE